MADVERVIDPSRDLENVVTFLMGNSMSKGLEVCECPIVVGAPFVL